MTTPDEVWQFVFMERIKQGYRAADASKSADEAEAEWRKRFDAKPEPQNYKWRNWNPITNEWCDGVYENEQAAHDAIIPDARLSFEVRRVLAADVNAAV